ncbi:MAG: amidohydrolase [Bacteroidetes bacterium]|nr:amidohydrolase [Bacteroidota bacterium]MBS1539340.1 amidohydrolase [Bacteroidota bacterium]
MKPISWLCFALMLFSCASKHEVADLIIKGGKIYTADDAHPMVEAVAVRGDKILFAGTEQETEKYKNEQTKVIDLQGKTMTPGFTEGHGHFFGLGLSELNLNLADTKSYEELVSKVKEAVAKAKPGEWIVGRGWHQDRWEKKPAKMVKGFQTHELLSTVSPNNPVFLSHASGHAAFVNAKAMEIAGVNLLSKEQWQKDLGEGGEIIRDQLGNPTGIFVEHAQSLIAKHIPSANEEKILQIFTLATENCLRNGITSFHDAGIDREELQVLQKLRQENKLSVRLYEMLSGSDRPLVKDFFQQGIVVDSAHWLTIRSVKLYSDGALGSRGAWLLQPYSDRPETSGMPLMAMDSVLAISREALKAGFQVCTHAIGDRANREILNQYEQAFKEYPSQTTNARFRIEHAQHIDPQDIPRFGKMGVMAAMQAIHLSSDRPWAIDRLGEKRIKEGAYMWQSLLKSGAHVVNGTDVPVEPINPIACFFASVTRQTLQGKPTGGYEPAEKMTRAQALKSYTLEAAFASFEENIKGSIEPGKLADFTVFSQDLMTVPDEQILSTHVEMTIVGGKVLFKKE